MLGQQRGELFGDLHRIVDELLRMYPDRPGLDRGGKRHAVAIDDVATRRQQPVARRSRGAAGRKDRDVEKPERDHADDAQEQQHHHHQAEMHERQRLLALPGEPDPIRARDEAAHGRGVFPLASR